MLKMSKKVGAIQRLQGIRQFTKNSREKRVCSYFLGKHFPMYEKLCKDLGFRLSFNDFQMGIFID